MSLPKECTKITTDQLKITKLPKTTTIRQENRNVRKRTFDATMGNKNSKKTQIYILNTLPRVIIKNRYRAVQR